MTRKIMQKIFVISLAVAILGGLALVVWQVVGLIVGNGAIIEAPSGVFKSVLCIASAVASVAAFMLTNVLSTAREYVEGQQNDD